MDKKYQVLQCPICGIEPEISATISCCSFLASAMSTIRAISQWTELVLRYREVIALEEIAKKGK